MIKELEKSSMLLEKKYSALKKKEEENGKLGIQLKRINIDLKKELKEKKNELKEIYRQISTQEQKTHRNEIQRIEKEIAGGFAHKIRNMYGSVILLQDKIYRDNSLANNKNALFEIFNIFKKNLSQSQFVKIIPVIEKINENHKRMSEMLKISDSAVNKNIKIIDTFLNYSDVKKSALMININDIINNAIEKNKESLLKYSIIVQKELKYKKPIPGNHEHFFMLIQNLLLNSINAIKNNQLQNKKNKITIKNYFADNKYVLEIKDNGPGIPEENTDNIFDPFFTTDKKQGTGLGLSICKKITELYNGSISAKNNVDRGVVFKIILPAGADRSRQEDYR